MILKTNIALKANLASLKTEVDQLGIEKLAPVPVDLIKLSDVVKNDVVKKAAYDKLVAKVNNIDTSDFVLKTKYQTDKTELEKKIPDVSDGVKKNKTYWIKNKILDVSSLAAKTALIAVEKKMAASVFNARLSQTNLITKTDFDAKLSSLNRKITSNKSKHLLVANELKKLKTFD